MRGATLEITTPAVQANDPSEFVFLRVFSALRGFQAGRDYYVAMCPLKLIPKIFLFDEDEIPAELRAQRALNKARVPEIARYHDRESSPNTSFLP